MRFRTIGFYVAILREANILVDSTRGPCGGYRVRQVEMVQYGHHRDQISPAVIGR